MIQLVECPRDAMQGISQWIPTDKKVNYLKTLAKVGFHTIDAGSFVSAKAVPQMQDSAIVFNQVYHEEASQWLAIVANKRGAEEGAGHPAVDVLGYPLSVSETFQQKNTNRSINEALKDLAEIAVLTKEKGKSLVVYLSMAFGNPYGDAFNSTYLEEFGGKLKEINPTVIALSDTVGLAKPEEIHISVRSFILSNTDTTTGVHLHSRPEDAQEKIMAAYEAGCRRFDGALLGYGGCPLADDKLIGNIPTEVLVKTLPPSELAIDSAALEMAKTSAKALFSVYL